MPCQEITEGPVPPDVAERVAVEALLIEANAQLPFITLAGCMQVTGHVLPYSVGRLGPRCDHCDQTLPEQFVWSDPVTNAVYGTLTCAALAALDLAARIAEEEGVGQ